MNRVFLDTNVLLDIIENREKRDLACQIIEWAAQDQFRRVYVSSLTMANAAFVIRRRGVEDVKQCISECMHFCNVLPMNDAQIYEVCRSGSSPDFEDNLQIMCAEYGNCDVIVTSNVDHFRAHTNIPVLSPEDFVGHFGK
ncbi:MAG: PIN domain-containing protein [Bacteroidales bacterium]|nr:PIN domain-containing protein [Candidatus Cryptobacteroides aphodequi]